jgi:hypothetical protein
MANPYYVRQGEFVPGTIARSTPVDAEFDAVEVGFDLLPGTAAGLKLGTSTYATEAQGATVNDYIATMPDTRTANAQGDEVIFEATHTNTGAITLQIDAIAAVPVVRADGSAAAGGELATGLVYAMRFDAAPSARFQLMNTDPALAADVTQVQGSSTDDPTAPGVFNANLPFRNANSDALGSLGFATNIIMALRNVVHGGDVVISAENAAGAVQTLFKADPDTREVTIDRDLEQLHDDTGAAAGPIHTLFRNVTGAASDVLGQTEFDGQSTTSVRRTYATIHAFIDDALNASEDGRLNFQTITAGALATRMDVFGDGRETLTAIAAPAASPLTRQVPDLALFRASVPATAGDSFSSISFESQNSIAARTMYGLLHAEADDDLSASEDGRLRFATIQAGTLTSVLQLAAGATLEHAGTARIATSTVGAAVTGTQIDLNAAADLLTEIKARNSIGGIQMRVNNTSGDGRIAQTDSAGVVEEAWLAMVRNGAVTASHNGIARLATTLDGIDVTGTLIDLINTGAVNADGVRWCRRCDPAYELRRRGRRSVDRPSAKWPGGSLPRQRGQGSDDPRGPRCYRQHSRPTDRHGYDDELHNQEFHWRCLAASR